MEILSLFITSWIPVLKLLLVTGVGSFIAIDFIGIFGDEARKHMNNVVFYVFTPSLVATNLSQTFTWERVVSIWFMPINIVLTFVIGSAFGWILNKITKAPSHLRPLILGCCASGNQGIMLLIVIPGICNEKSSPFGDATICNEQALAYASLSMGIAHVVFWSYVYNIVRLSLDSGEPKLNAPDREGSVLELRMEEGRKSINPKDSFSTIAEENYEKSPRILSTVAPTKSKAQTLKENIKSFYQRPAVVTFRRLFSPSTYGVIVGLLIGVISPIKKVLIGENAPLRSIHGAANLLGEGAVVAMPLIMGGNLLKGFRKSDTKVSYIFGIMLIRYLFLPLVGVGIVKGVIHFGMFHPDPLYQFVLLVQYALPPAMNLGVIIQLFGAGESECSVIMLWTYAFTLILFPLWAGFFMWLVS